VAPIANPVEHREAVVRPGEQRRHEHAVDVELAVGRRVREQAAAQVGQGQQRLASLATPSSNSSLDYRRSDARIVENGFATSGGLSKSAKVVLVA